MNRPSLACEISVVWIFYMIVNMKLQYLASMIKVKKQLSNRQPEKTEGALSKHLLPPQLFYQIKSFISKVLFLILMNVQSLVIDSMNIF